MDHIVLGALILLAGFMAARVMAARAFLKLPQELKAPVVETLMKRRLRRLLPMFALLGAYALGARHLEVRPRTLLTLFMGCILAVISVQAVSDRRALARVGAPLAYLQATWLSYGLQVAGILGFGAVLWFFSG
jgi:hypothetical protein